MFISEIMMFVVAGLALFTLVSWFITFFVKED
jgi:hypothetical protein